MTSKKNKEINHSNLVTIKSITDNQKLVFDSWKEGKNQFQSKISQIWSI